MAGDERRQMILTEAMRLFSEDGFRGTTTKKIAEAAGISEAMVFRHFANKEELYSAILDRKACSHKLDDPLESVKEQIANKDDFGLFYGFALNALEHHKEDQEFIRLLLFSALEGHDLAKMFFGSFVTGMYETLSAYISERQRDGVFKEIEPKAVVRAFVGMLIHHSLTNMLFDPEQKLLRISEEEAARSFATILLEGISK
jgi:AcrR family transcriptional regulator